MTQGLRVLPIGALVASACFGLAPLAFAGSEDKGVAALSSPNLATASASGVDGSATPNAAASAPIAQPAPATTPAPIPVIPVPRKLWAGEDGALHMLNRSQVRWTRFSPDARSTNAPRGGEFRIRRAKTELTGWVFSEHLTYELQLSWAGPEPGGSTQTALEDLVLSWDASRDGRFKVIFGQFKVPLGRQEMTSSARLQFADRDILSSAFTRGRDVGVQLGGALMQGKLEYMAGIFNGNPASHLGNDNDKYQYNARVMFEPWGKVGYSESDFESTDKPLLAIAGQLEHNDERLKKDVEVNNFRKSVILGADAAFKYKGFSAFVEIFAQSLTPQKGAKYESRGVHGQAGYFIVRNKIEAAVRYAHSDPSDRVVNDQLSERGVALNYFIRKHGLKVQGDFRELQDKSRRVKDRELRLQTQIIF